MQRRREALTGRRQVQRQLERLANLGKAHRSDGIEAARRFSGYSRILAIVEAQEL